MTYLSEIQETPLPGITYVSISVVHEELIKLIENPTRSRLRDSIYSTVDSIDRPIRIILHESLVGH
jgi:hypothetical protein